jgi:hypothetical protein
MADSFLSEDEIARRTPMWCALAELFLDTEMEVRNYRDVAEAAQAGGFSIEEVRRILEAEVFPAFVFNILDIAGEWAGFHPDDVRKRVLGVLGQISGYRPRNPSWTLLFRSKFMATEWPKVEAALEGREPDLSRPAKPEKRGRLILTWLCLFAIASGLALVFGPR